MSVADRILYEDNHILIFFKNAGEIVQGDKTGDECLVDILKKYIKDRDKKPGNVFLGLTHRIDRPTSGLVVFAKTSKALSRLNAMFQNGDVHKTYLVLIDKELDHPEGTLEDYIYRNSKENKSYVVNQNHSGAKKAVLNYKLARKTKTYFLYEVELLTGRHHQIRVQFSSRGFHIKGDVKYGAKRPNSDASISLCSYKIEFEHPVSHQKISVSKLPEWKELS